MPLRAIGTYTRTIMLYHQGQPINKCVYRFSSLFPSLREKTNRIETSSSCENLCKLPHDGTRRTYGERREFFKSKWYSLVVFCCQNDEKSFFESINLRMLCEGKIFIGNYLSLTDLHGSREYIHLVLFDIDPFCQRNTKKTFIQ